MLPNINLLPQYERRQSLIPILMAIGFIICILLFGGLIFAYGHFHNQLIMAEEQYKDYEQDKESLEEKLATLETKRTESLANAIDFAEKIQLPVSPLLNELISQFPPESFLKSYQFSDQEISIESEHENKTEIATYTSKLVELKYLKDIKLRNVESVGFTESEDEEYFYRANHLIEIDRHHLIEDERYDD